MAYWRRRSHENRFYGEKNSSSQSSGRIFDAVPHLIRLPERKARLDCCCISVLSVHKKAMDKKFLKGILLRYRAKGLVGVTVLDASKAAQTTKATALSSLISTFREFSKRGSSRLSLNL